MDSLFDTKHLYKSYFQMAFPVVLGLVVTLIYNLAGCDPMKVDACPEA